jgi:hypothetical protein
MTSVPIQAAPDQTKLSRRRHTFGVLVGEGRSVGLHHGLRREVFGRNELEAPPLPILFLLNEVKDLRILLLKRADQALILLGSMCWLEECINQRPSMLQEQIPLVPNE